MYQFWLGCPSHLTAPFFTTDTTYGPNHSIQYKQPVDSPDRRQLNTDSLLVLEGASPLLEPKLLFLKFIFSG